MFGSGGRKKKWYGRCGADVSASVLTTLFTTHKTLVTTLHTLFWETGTHFSGRWGHTFLGDGECGLATTVLFGVLCWVQGMGLGFWFWGHIIWGMPEFRWRRMRESRTQLLGGGGTCGITKYTLLMVATEREGRAPCMRLELLVLM